MPDPVPSPAPPAGTMPRAMFVYTLLYGGMTVLAGVLAFKQVRLWPSDLAVEAGIFPYLLLVVISSTLAQLYGQSRANLLVLWGFVPLAIAATLIVLVLGLPASPDMPAERLDAFGTVLSSTPRIMAAGPAAYGVSLLLNVWIFSRLRGVGESGTFALMLRGAIASALSQAIDSVIFITLAFYGSFPIGGLLVGQIIAKVALSLVLVPFLISGGVALARRLDAA